MRVGESHKDTPEVSTSYWVLTRSQEGIWNTRGFCKPWAFLTHLVFTSRVECFSPLPPKLGEFLFPSSQASVGWPPVLGLLSTLEFPPPEN